MSKAIHRFRRKRVQLNEKVFEFFPWIGVADQNFDLFRNSFSSLTPLPDFTAVADQFLWTDTAEVISADYQSFYGSYFNPTTGQAIFESTLLQPKRKTLISSSIRDTTISTSSYYLGGTCYYDPSAVRVVSAFEDSSISSWPGLTDFNSALTFQGAPVGARCFAREGTRSGVESGGSSTLNEGTTFFSGTWASSPSGPFRGFFKSSFQETTTYSSVAETCRLPVIAGEDLTIYFCTKSGSTTVFTINKSTDLLPGSQFVLQDNADFGGPIALINGAIATDATSTSVTTSSSFGTGPLAQLTAYDLTNSTFSDGVGLTDSSSKYWTDITITGTVAIGQTIDVLLNSGGYSGTDYEQTFSFVENQATGYSLTHDTTTGAGSTLRDLITALDATLPVGRSEFITPIIPPETIQEDILDWQEIDTVWRDAGTSQTGGDDIVFTLDEIPASSSSIYSSDSDYRFKLSDFQGEWILVSKLAGKRYYLSFLQSTTFTFLDDLSGGSSPFPVSTANLNGNTFQFSIDEEETITWDSVAGELVDMTTDYFLYSSNSIDEIQFPAERTQLYGNNKQFTLLTEGGGGS